MALPPGGFIMLAFLIVGKRMIDNVLAARKIQPIIPATEAVAMVD